MAINERISNRRVRKLLKVDEFTTLLSLRSDSWKICMPRESVMLSATARTSSDPIIDMRGSELLLRLMIKARLVTVADVAPKLYFVRWVIWFRLVWLLIYLIY